MRLIDADALIKVIMSSTSYSNYEWAMYADDIIETYIDLAPTIDIEERLNDAYAHGWSDAEAKYHDAVEVVRCKDCIYYDWKGYRQGCGQCQWSFAVVEDDDYCSKGERREQ